MKKSGFLIVLFFVLFSLLTFWQFFLKGLFPFPGNYMLVWFEPWKEIFSPNGVPMLSHKAIAHDVFRQIYPFLTLAFDLVKSMQFPLWNPYNGAGMPLLATMNIGFFDPLNILFFIFPNYLAWSISIIIQPFLIGVCTYLFARKLGLSKLSSVFTATVFTFSGVVTVRLVYQMFGFAFAMLPLGLYAIESFVQQNTSKKIFLLPFAVAFIIFSTQPQDGVYMGGIMILYVVFRSLQARLKLSAIMFLVLLFLLGTGLSLIQVLPSAELSLQANVTTESSKFIFDRFLLSPLHLITIVIPNFFGSLGTYNFFENTDYIETMAYLGSIPVFLALFSLFIPQKSKRNVSFFFFFTSVVFALTTLQNPLSRFLFSLPIPIISTGIPARIFLLTTFGLAVCSGFGLDFLERKKEKAGRFVMYALPMIAFFALALIGSLLAKHYNIPCPQTTKNCQIVALRNSIIEATGFLIFALTAVVLLVKQEEKFKKLIPVSAIGIVLFLGLYNSSKFQPFSVKQSFFPKNALIEKLTTLTDGRIFGLGNANLQTDFATWFRFYDPQYYQPLYIKRYGELVGFANTGMFPPPLLRSDVNITNDILLKDKLATDRRQRLFDLLNVKYLILPKAAESNGKIIWQNSSWQLEQNTTALPHAYAVDSVVQKSTDKEILQTLFSPSFSYQTKAVVQQAVPLEQVSGTLNANIVITDYKATFVTLKTVSNKPAFLMLLDNYYAGWNAFIDGKKSTVYRANYTFRGMVIPTGVHTVTFLYEPLSFIIGSLLSGLSCLVLIIIFLLSLRPKKTAAQHQRK